MMLLAYLFEPDTITFWGVLAAAVHFLGIVHAIHAVMNVRLSQSAIAWSVFLLALPYLGIPAYWIFGQRKFNGYTEALRNTQNTVDKRIEREFDEVKPLHARMSYALQSLERTAEKLWIIPFTIGNKAGLLVDGKETYDSMIAGIRRARSYILFQSYIINDDEVGRRFLAALAEAAASGVKVFLLYDEIGSNDLSTEFLSDAARAGIAVSGFKTTKGRGNRFQLNFRNHRKILVIDGKVGFTGGLNIGEEQLGRDRAIGYWRDTHVRIEGPAVLSMQLSFLRDWYWATDELPEVNWDVEAPSHEGAEVLVLPTGPADALDSCSLFYGSLIDVARERLWIVTPYFVPDDPSLAALKTAAMRGVDVRILIPQKPDHIVTQLCTISFYAELKAVGVKMFCYTKGFSHQKVILVDEVMAGVGSVNFDNRSFHLNFEVMAFVANSEFVSDVTRMLERDFTNSCAIDLDEYEKHRFPYQVAVKVARLGAMLL